jgi:oxygen-independent coproporphyrinogen III oxidase
MQLSTDITPRERFLRAARGQEVDRPPVWLMRQAGRYLPEYMAIRAEHSFLTCCETPELATEISLQPWRRFGMDGIVVFCDILMPLTALGLEFCVTKGIGPQLAPAITTAETARALPTPDASQDYRYLTDTLTRIRETVRDDAAVIGFAGAPWTVALYMVAGGKFADHAGMKQRVLDDTPLREALFARLVPMTAQYLSVQVDAGADVVQLFDTWGGLLSAEEYRAHVLPAMHDLLTQFRALQPTTPVIIYCNNGGHLVQTLATLQPDVLSVDWRQPLSDVRREIGSDIALQGNLDPEILLTDPGTIRAATHTMLREIGGTGYIANLGHGVIKETPPTHVAAFVETVQQWKPHRKSLETIINGTAVTLDANLVQRYDRPGPRYTSYPTAPQWKDEITSPQYSEILDQSNAQARPLSLYFHLPFCEEHCTFCGCNVIITKKREIADPYLNAIAQELRLTMAHMDTSRTITQFHFGGGTPTYFSPAQLERLWKDIAPHLRFADDAEIGIEVDPRVTTREHLAVLRQLGFNRLSMGIQDFRPEVQQAINRIQPYDVTAELINAARQLGFASINVDLIYGLPHQTPEGFAETIEQIITLEPDRIACYSFAFVPWLKAQQRKIDAATLPEAQTKLSTWCTTITQLHETGYHMIGFDHFARADDELAKALHTGSLWRNFQGYSTKAGTDLLAFGITGIGDIDGHYVQNVKKLTQYYTALSHDTLPVERACHLSADDLQRREIIRELLCNGRAHLGIANFSTELATLQPMIDDQLLTLTDATLTITPRGRLFARNVAMAFDTYLDATQDQRYSRTV